MAELAISSYYESFLVHKTNLKIGIGRAGNVIGGGDYSSNRIVPDCVRSWQTSQSVKIRKPNSIALATCIGAAFWLSQTWTELQLNHSINGQAFNFGPNSDANRTRSLLVNYLKDQTFIVDEAEYFNEAGLLQLNCEKAKSL